MQLIKTKNQNLNQIMKTGIQIVECVPNFSEGRDMNIIRQITDEIEKYDKENEMLLNKINKIEKNISQELNNKDIMFMRLQQKESEVEFLQIQLDALIKGTNIKPSEEKKIVKNEESGFFSSAKNKMKALKEKAMGKIKKIDFSDLINNNLNNNGNNNNDNNSENINNNEVKLKNEETEEENKDK